MKIPHLTLAEWRYLFNPLTTFPHVVIGHTFLELIFLGAIKFETVPAPYHGPKDSNIKSVLNFVSKGENIQKLSYKAHQQIFIDDLFMIEKSTLGEYLQRLSLILGKDQGYIFNQDYLKAQLQERDILWSRNIILSAIRSQSLSLRAAKKGIKKDLVDLKIALSDAKNGDAYLERLGPLVYLGDLELFQKVRGRTYRGNVAVENSYYEYNIDTEASDPSDLIFRYPNMKVEALLEKFKKYFPLVSVSYG